MKKPTTTDRPRFAGANWDTDGMTVRLSGGGEKVRRKVLTNGVTLIPVDRATANDIIHHLRFGNEVRLIVPKWKMQSVSFRAWTRSARG